MTAKRFNQGKAMLGFLLQFPTAMEAFARVKEMGAIKYERDNWKLGGKPDWEYLDAAMRHLVAHAAYLAGEGEYYAEDTGCSHLAHASWNMWALQELNYRGCTHDPEIFDKMATHWREQKEPQKDKPDEDPNMIESSDTMAKKLWENHVREELRLAIEYLQRAKEKDKQDDTEEPT